MEMGTLLELRCANCGSVWEVSATTRDTKTVFCPQCSDFIAIGRIAYSSARFQRCTRCGSDVSTQPPFDPNAMPCPACAQGALRVEACGSYLPRNVLPLLSEGDIVDAWFDNWSVHVFDLPAIPRENVMGLESGNLDGLWRLEVLRTPTGNEDDRQYYFRVQGPR